MMFFTEAARGRNTHWLWYLLCLFVTGVGYFVGQIPLLGVVQYRISTGAVSTAQAEDFAQTLDFSALGIPSALGLLLILGSFIVALITLYLYVVHVHGRRFSSLITAGKTDWSKVAFAFLAWLVLTFAAEFVMYLLNGEAYRVTIQWDKWIPLMCVVLLVLPIQTSYEELLVRGYLMQRIGWGTGRPLVAIVSTSLLFGLMHIANPEIARFGLGTMMAYFVSVGMFLALLTVLDDGLEYALGIHAATNIYGAGFVTYEGSALQTDALFRVDEVNAEMTLVAFLICAVIFYAAVKYRFGIRGLRVVLETLQKQNDPEPSETETLS